MLNYHRRPEGTCFYVLNDSTDEMISHTKLHWELLHARLAVLSSEWHCEVLCGCFVVQSIAARCSRCAKQEYPTKVFHKNVPEY